MGDRGPEPALYVPKLVRAVLSPGDSGAEVRALIELRGAAKSYGTTVALHATNLRAEEGKTTALIGPSGCGKSTILRLVVALIQPTEGEVLFDGKPVGEDILRQRRRMGYVIQDGGL